MVYKADYYPDIKGEEHYCDSPEIYICKLKDVVVIGGSAVMMADEYALTDVCDNYKDDRVDYIAGPILKADRNDFYIEVSKDIRSIKNTVVNLSGLAASNYYHLTIELLSRFKYIQDNIKNEEYVVLLDKDAEKYPQYCSLIKRILGEQKIEFIDFGERLFCNKVIYPSVNTWMPFNVKSNLYFCISDNIISKSAVYNVRNNIHIEATDKNKRRKIFISRRNSGFSRLENEEDVAALFVEYGYEIICLEKVSYADQVRLFAEASCIVGASGAALTNVIYCKSDAVIGCFIPRKYNFYIYSSMAHMIGCKVLFFDADVVNSSFAFSAESCKVNLKKCRQYIKLLEKLMGEEERT
ncbi:Protein of unknown function [Pseudobutyrivibrio sp. JW11]|nr:Protein of unknown function [Pseudobutyrivibrio sp. JW11]